MIDIKHVEQIFKDYVNTFDMSDENILLKYEHTYEVVKIIGIICDKKNLSEEQKLLAQTIAYLHDIGRFEQITQTGTFVDKLHDHADNGADLLFNRHLIDKFNVSKRYYKIIEKSVRLHNKLKIDKDLTNTQKLFVNLIRDADKLDIYRVRNKYSDDHFIYKPTDIVLKDFLNYKSINIKNIENKSDSIMCVMAFVFDLAFEESKETLRELGYYQRFIDGIKVEDNKVIFEKLKNEVYRFLNINKLGDIKMLEKKYEHKSVEKDKYNIWKENGYFNSDNKSNKPPFCIVIPPPNVTGKLHIGHAYDVSIQDTIIRYKRMQGFDTLWLPGMDHAAIATEAKVVKRLKDQGIDKYEYGREKFLDACWDWTKEYGDNIRNQWAAMGISVDYNKERFTLDEGMAEAVKKVFVDYYNEGLIYRGEKIINWDPAAQTALSNEEVIYSEEKSAFYHIKYKIEGTEEYLDVATTRPETLFGDTAVAVNENDDRYKKYVGKNVELPFMDKVIPIITDEHADMEKGTGVVKITPAHDPNDFEVGNRHNLERICIMNDDATMNEKVPKKYQGMTREKCREVLLEDLKESDLLLEIEPLTHEVGHSERTGVMVEPMIKKQWFVKMDGLSQMVLDIQKDDEKKVNFVPGKFENTLKSWMTDCHDWCISRQLWWGHRIPAWYKDDEVYVGMEEPTGEGWKQDEDVLDTWFSSALWAFATLGWPNTTEDLEKYFPTSCLVTGYDIIFFWVSRMMFQSEKVMGVRPFKDCVIHGLIRDKEGRKMSKSLGNGVDPFDMIEKYGTDALRYYLTTDCAFGTDLRFDETKMTSTWNYINKLWNASRYVLMNIEDLKNLTFDNLTDEDKWILSKYERIVDSTVKHMDKYEFNLVGSETYSFVYDDFCSNYIEFSKFNSDSNTTKSVLCYVLTGILKLLHPFMPFVTEEIYGMLPIKENESIMISKYPKYEEKFAFEEIESAIDNKIEFIKAYRNVKTENNIPKEAKVLINTDDEIIIKMLKLQDVRTSKRLNIKSYKVHANEYDATIFYEKEETEDDKAAKENQIKILQDSIARREKLLSNENYVNKAPANIVEMDRQKLAEEKKKLEELTK